MTTARPKTYSWVTWLAPLISGDKSCRWAAWVKSHYFYEKRPDPDGNRLVAWKAEHAEMVRARESALRAAGIGVVLVEDQNKFAYKGHVAVVGGKPDLVSISGAGDRALISDCKTGQERDSDVVQVATYMMLVPRIDGLARGLPTDGEVVYKTRVRPVPSADAGRLFPLIIAQVQAIASDVEPRRTPSAAECPRCDIAGCPDRVEAEELSDEPEKDAVF